MENTTLANFYHPFPLVLPKLLELADIKLTIGKHDPNIFYPNKPIYLRSSSIQIHNDSSMPEEVAQVISATQYLIEKFVLLNEHTFYTTYTNKILKLCHCTRQSPEILIKELRAKTEPVLIPLFSQNRADPINLATLRFAPTQRVKNSPKRVDVTVIETQDRKIGITDEQELIIKELRGRNE